MNVKKILAVVVIITMALTAAPVSDADPSWVDHSEGFYYAASPTQENFEILNGKEYSYSLVRSAITTMGFKNDSLSDVDVKFSNINTMVMVAGYSFDQSTTVQSESSRSFVSYEMDFVYQGKAVSGEVPIFINKVAWSKSPMIALGITNYSANDTIQISGSLKVFRYIEEDYTSWAMTEDKGVMTGGSTMTDTVVVTDCPDIKLTLSGKAYAVSGKSSYECTEDVLISTSFGTQGMTPESNVELTTNTRTSFTMKTTTLVIGDRTCDGEFMDSPEVKTVTETVPAKTCIIDRHAYDSKEDLVKSVFTDFEGDNLMGFLASTGKQFSFGYNDSRGYIEYSYQTFIEKDDIAAERAKATVTGSNSMLMILAGLMVVLIILVVVAIFLLRKGRI